jgi:hypothetical protein
MSSRVLYSFNSLIASNSHTMALVRLFPAFPGFTWLSFWNCKQFAMRAYRVAREKWEPRICCCIGLTRNWET